MKITMVSIGSMGDVAPYVVLGKELQERGHKVTICTFSNFEVLITESHLRYMPLYGDSKNFISKLMSGGSGPAYLKSAISALSELVTPLMRDIENACRDADGILSVYLGEVIQGVAEALHKPYMQTQFFPMDATADTPVSSAPFRSLGRGWNRLSYRLAYLLISSIEKHFLDDWRVAHGLPKKRISSKRSYEVCGHTMPVLYAIPSLVMPRPKEWPESIQMTGFWREEPQPYEPEPELQAFLDQGTKPIYIGFGSMNDAHMQETMNTVLQAVRHTGLRAVISSGWSDASLRADEQIFPVHYVDHDWLFERVRATVHHGGAGTTAATLYAGRPTLIIPFSGDQPFWGEQVEKLGLGPKAIPRKKLTVDRLAKALSELTKREEYAENALTLQRKLLQTHPVRDAADYVEEQFGNWS